MRSSALPQPRIGETLPGLPPMARVMTSIGPLARARYINFAAVVQVVSLRSRRVPYANEFRARRARQRKKWNQPVAIVLPNGTTVVQVTLNPRQAFSCAKMLRQALDLAELKPGAKLALDLRSHNKLRKLTEICAYGCLVHSAVMPSFSKASQQHKPGRLSVNGYSSRSHLGRGIATAEANIISRQLSILPGNKLNAKNLVEMAHAAAKIHQLEFTHYDIKRLKDMGANLFLAVMGQGKHGGLVRVSYRCGRRKAKRIALLGKGVCFDTGGVNLKPHQHMLGMQGDMAGASAVLGAIGACARLAVQVDIDAWLAVAENLIEAQGIRPGDTITSHSGKTVEIVHTDAEGRLLLADGLSILAKDKPDMVVTLATLTGSMITAIGTHMSGITGTPTLVSQATKISAICGERLVPFPLPNDYRSYLDSQVADFKQCSENNDADHILASLFLSEFTHGLPWLHMDMSASSCKGGLGAIPTEQTGFGAAWLVTWLIELAKEK